MGGRADRSVSIRPLRTVRRRSSAACSNSVEPAAAVELAAHLVEADIHPLEENDKVVDEIGRFYDRRLSVAAHRFDRQLRRLFDDLLGLLRGAGGDELVGLRKAAAFAPAFFRSTSS